jgi:hypothetical protein
MDVYEKFQTFDENGIVLGYIRSGFNSSSGEQHTPIMGELEEELEKSLGCLGTYEFVGDGQIDLKRDIFLSLKNLKRNDDEKLVPDLQDQLQKN